jgi:hypothetical protein
MREVPSMKVTVPLAVLPVEATVAVMEMICPCTMGSEEVMSEVVVAADRRRRFSRISTGKGNSPAARRRARFDI